MKFTMTTYEAYNRHLQLQDSTLGTLVSTLAVHKGTVYKIDTSSYKVVHLVCTSCVICSSEVSSSTRSVLA